MKKQILSLMFLFGIISIPCLGQTVSYYYDATGNRTERVIELNASMQSASLESEEKAPENPIVDTLQDIEIQIYPNPTRGLVSIEIPEFEKLKNGIITIHNAARQTLFQTRINANTLQFDLSRYPVGLYIMTIQCNGEVAHWKIIKV